MHPVAAISTLAMMLMLANAQADDSTLAMTLVPNGSQSSILGSTAMFVGTVRIDPLVSAHEPSRVSAAYVSFEPGARSAWHTHPLGQTLVITAGTAGCSSKAGRNR